MRAGRIIIAWALASVVAFAGGSGAEAGTAPAAQPANVGHEVLDALGRGESVDVFVMLEGHRPGRIRADLEQRARAAQDATLAGAGRGIRVRRRFTTIPAFTARVTSEADLRSLAGRPDVQRIDVDSGGGTGSLANTVPIIGADNLHALGLTGAGTTVAVLDSGHDLDHPDLAGAVVAEACFGVNGGTGFCHNGTTRQTGPGSAEDDAGHGTHVTGIVTSNGVVSSVGVAPGSGIVALKVTDDCNYAGCFYAFSEVVAALDYIVAHPEFGVDVVNMSLVTSLLFSGDCDNAASFLSAGAASVANLRAAGIVVVAAAGNNGSQTQMAAPACLSGVVSVGATTPSDVVAGFSNTNSSTDVLAPGNAVVSDAIGGGTFVASGTSMASPAVAGCVALLHQGVPLATPAAIESALEGTGTPIARGSVTYPRINCDAARTWLVDGPTQPQIFVGDASIVEGDTTTRNVKVPVSLSAPSTTEVTVNMNLTGMSATGATAAGGTADFKNTFRTKTLKFKPNATGFTPVTATVSIPIFTDVSDEGDETLRVSLTQPTATHVITDDTGVVTIIDDDPGSGPTFGIGDAAVTEGESGKRVVSVAITLNAPQTEDVRVDTVIDGASAFCIKVQGTPPPGVDCNDLGSVVKTVVFKRTAAGVTPVTKYVNVTLYPDMAPESDETLTIALSNPRPVSLLSSLVLGLSRGVGTVTIHNDD